MIDKELLELAAKAAGTDVLDVSHMGAGLLLKDGGVWNPLADDGDALRLAVKLNININWRININGTFVYANHEPEQSMDDPYAATRRAIVRAAADIGKTL